MTRAAGALAFVAIAATSIGWTHTRSADPIVFNVVVEDTRGKPAAGLGPADFIVLVDGLPATVSAAAIDSTPLSAVLLIDVTASQHACPNGVAGIPSTARRSTGSQFPEPIPPALAPFQLRGLRTGDRIRAGTIGRTIELDPDFATDANVIRKRFRALFDRPPIDWLGPSPIWDAVGEAVTALPPDSTHRAVIVVSDGEATGNLRGRREIASEAAKAGVPVSVAAEEAVVSVVPNQTRSPSPSPAEGLMALAEETGGVSVLDAAVNSTPPGPCATHAPELALQYILDRLHQSYRVAVNTFADRTSGSTLEVRTRRTDMRIAAAPKIVPGTRAR